MSALLDARFAALRGQGYTGSVNDMLLQWLQAAGATSSALADAWRELLVDVLAVGPGSAYQRNDYWWQWLKANGYDTAGDHLNDMERLFWIQGGVLSSDFTSGTDAGTLRGARTASDPSSPPAFGTLTGRLTSLTADTGSSLCIAGTTPRGRINGADHVDITIAAYGSAVEFAWDAVNEDYRATDAALATWMANNQGLATTYTVVAQPLRVTVSGTEFRLGDKRFQAFGVQPYYHLWVKDYFTTGGAAEQNVISGHMKNARNFGCRIMRVHLDLWDFLSGPNLPGLVVNQTAIDNFLHWLAEAEKNGIYLLVSGNNTWIPADAPGWYDAETYLNRWEVQKVFFQELVSAIVNSGNAHAVLGYELMSEPNITENGSAEWYLGPYEDTPYYFVQNIARGVAGGTGPTVARDWIIALRDVIKTEDPKALVTIGAISLKDPDGSRNANGPFGLSNTEDLLDFTSPHIPTTDADELQDVIDGLVAWSAGTKPSVLGETTLLSAVYPTLDIAYAEAIPQYMEGAITFYWGFAPRVYPGGMTPPPAPEPLNDVDTGTLGYAFQEESLDMFVNTANLPQEMPG